MFRPNFATWIGAAAIIAGVGAANIARADIIADTRDLGGNITSDNYVQDMNPTLPPAGPQTFESFTYGLPGQANYALNQIQLMVQTAGSTGGSLVVTLWADDGTQDGPGTGAKSLLGQLAPISLSSLANAFGAGSYGLLTINNAQVIAGFGSLIEGDTYWIGIATAGDSNGSDGTTVAGTENNPVGTTAWATANTTQNNSGDYVGFCVSTNSVSPQDSCGSTSFYNGDTGLGTDLTQYTVTERGGATPEPATLGILGTAIAGLGLLRRRAKRNAVA
jgi:PEP-CTERM motif